MPKKDAGTGIGPLDTMLPVLRHLGPGGFVFLHNWGWRGPEFAYSEFSKAWQQEYEAKNYAWADPVLSSAMLHPGDRRWSEVLDPDRLGVSAAARRHGLSYGAILSRGTIRKSVLSLARADRELDDGEMVLLSTTFDHLVKEVKVDGGLSKPEIETLRHLRDGMSYKEMADILGISISTVKLRLERCRLKLGGRSIVQGLALATQRNLL